VVAGGRIGRDDRKYNGLDAAYHLMVVVYTKIYITAREIIKKVCRTSMFPLCGNTIIEKIKRGNTIFYLPLIIMVVLYTKIYITARGIIEKVKHKYTIFNLPIIKE
jgi:hypothetical protein